MLPSELRTHWEQRPLVLDGANGTELERRRVLCPPPLWSAAALRDQPRVVADVHREYAGAGAQIITANTFRTNPRALQTAGLIADGAALNAAAVGLAREATAGRTLALIAASVAPVEDCYQPERTPDVATLTTEHEQMAEWLAAAAPDLVWIETMGTIREAQAAASAARLYRLPLAVSFALREDGMLLGGESLEEAVAAVEVYDPLAIGLNCVPPDGVTAHLPRLRRCTQRGVAVYAHVGNPRPTPGWSYAQVEVPPERYAEYARQWRTMGANIIGGCCGTTPAHIAAVAATLNPSRDSAAEQ